MKKPRDGLIKSLRYVCLMGILALGLMTIIATGGGGGSGGSSSGTPPEILNVVLYDSNYAPCFYFDIGDQAYFGVRAKDPDKDMVNLYMNLYYPVNATTPYNSILMPLPSTSEIEEIFYSGTPIHVTGPSGSWRIEFQIEDSKGNDSNIWKIHAIVN